MAIINPPERKLTKRTSVHCTERFLDRRARTWHKKRVHNVIRNRNTQNSDKDIFCEHFGQFFPMLHKLSVHKSIFDTKFF